MDRVRLVNRFHKQFFAVRIETFLIQEMTHIIATVSNGRIITFKSLLSYSNTS